MANILYDRMKETARWDRYKNKVDWDLMKDVDEAIKSARRIDWQKFHDAMDLLSMGGVRRATRLLERAIKR